MKKKMVKKVLTAVLAMTMVFGLAACGKASAGAKTEGGTDTTKAVESELTGYYASNANVAFMSMYPGYTYKQSTFGVQTIETFSDGTYCLTSTDTVFSGALLFNDDGTHEEIPRGSINMIYDGTYTSEEEEGIMTLTLSTPTAVMANSSLSAGSEPIGYLNTEAWTDEMGAAVGGDAGTMTAKDYLATVAFPETTIIVDVVNTSFDYADLSVAAE
ncbi:hypothetical protein [Anaerobium acetethylicum]|uniref:Lipoprotein n=1 Tax=Anaerobium acetethylicum TaxID=1619234 RepID=A0A1D3TW57_9FIRM|nr:hypothetical protein [Anaerobium acetethylicum]SCP98433.1 hypothetical protein SAMN05421730_102043 [Anaerobium acetethylicum]